MLRKKLFFKMRFKHFFVALIALCASVNVGMAETKTFVVTNTNVEGEGSLAEIIESANTFVGNTNDNYAEITFDLPQESDRTIVLTSDDVNEKSSCFYLLNQNITLDGGTDKVIFEWKGTNNTYLFGLGNNDRLLNVHTIGFKRVMASFIGDFGAAKIIKEISNCIFDGNYEKENWRDEVIKERNQGIDYTSDGCVIDPAGGSVSYMSDCEFLNYDIAIANPGRVSKMERCRFTNIYKYAIQSYCDCLFEDCTFDNCGVGVLSSYNTIKNCSFTNCVYGVVYKFGPGVLGSTFTNCTTSLYIENDIDEISDCVFSSTDVAIYQETGTIGAVTGCTFSNGTKKGLIQEDGLIKAILSSSFIGNDIAINIKTLINNIEKCTFSENEYSIEGNVSTSTSISENIFEKNKKSCIISNYHGNYSKNLFIDNEGIDEGEKAIDQSTGYLAPVITEIIHTYKKYVVKGTSSTSQVEVFLSNGPQTATKYLGVADVISGAFEVDVDESLVSGDNICFIACGVETELGDPFCTIENLNYYVKTVAEGDGSGSSWDNAMNPESFSKKLSDAKDGSTFHVAEGDYTLDQYADETDLNINSNVIIIGGYWKEAKTGAISDPTLYTTNLKSETRLKFYLHKVGIRYKNLSMTNVTTYGEAGSHSIYADSCKFYGSDAFYVTTVDTTMFTYCLFDGKGHRSYNGINISIDGSNYFELTSSTVCNQPTYYYGDAVYVNNSKGDVLIKNSTFVNNASEGMIKVIGSCVTTLINNTIVGNPIRNWCPSDTAVGTIFLDKAILIGNIYAGHAKCEVSASEILKSENNVIYANYKNASESDKLVNPEDLLNILEGQIFDNENCPYFIPVLADNGGYTPTVKLLTDELEDGTSIRFPLTETTVTTDQRGVVRKPNTCVGAYEIKETVETEINESICKTGKYTDNGFDIDASGLDPQTYTYTRFESGTDEDYQYTLNLTVLPIDCNTDVNAYDYYVTTTGTGTGASWEDPMSPEAFAAMLPLARSGATFHVGAGSYDLYNINNSNSDLQINSGITIRGGYPKNPVTGVDDKSDPAVNTTSFYTNSVRFYYDYPRFVINSSEVDTVKFKSITFNKATIQNKSKHLAKLVVDSCTFMHAFSDYNAAIYSDYDGDLDDIVDSVVIKNTYFPGLNYQCKYSVAKILACGNFLMSKCCVNSYISELPLLDIPLGNKIIINSTFTNNNVPYLSTYNNSYHEQFFYNTIVGNTFTDWTSAIVSSTGKYRSEFSNNIIGGGDGITNFGAGKFEYMSNNLTDRATADASALQVASFAGLLDGTANADGTFTPVLAKNGGFTNNVKVLTDVLADGTSIRRTLNKRTLTEDQRGVMRFDMTCPGAYEADKTVILNESICKDGKYEENNFDIDAADLNPGTYTYEKTVDHIAYTLNLEVSAIRCGINTKALAYYVKTDAEGTGDGSRWEDAMSAADFAAVLPVAASGATFYVAEGVYKPMLDVNGEIPTKSADLVYAINNDVTIQGGFSPKAETGAVSDPATYHTIFNGDIEGDDVVDESLDDDGYAQLKASNTADNASRIFLIKGDATKVNFNGVEVTRSSGDGIQPIVEDVDLNIDYSKFYYNYSEAILLYQKNNTITVNHSDFERNARCIYGAYTENVDVQNTSFIGNVAGQILSFPYVEQGILSFDNIQVKDNKGEIFLQNQNSTIKNSFFDNNKGSDFITFVGTTDNSSLNIESSEFTNNKTSILFSNVSLANSISIDKCQFEGNEVSTELIMLGDVELLNVQNSSFKNNTGGYLVYDAKSSSSHYGGSLSFENCQVLDNTFSPSIFFVTEVDKVSLKSNTFSKNTTDGTFFDVIQGNKFFENNTFSENTCKTFISFVDGQATLKNNTIVNNTCTNSSFGFYKTETTITNLYNNTIVGNRFEYPIIINADHADDATVVGNIILGNVVSSGETEVLSFPLNGTVSDNLMTYLCYNSDGNFGCRELPANNFSFIDDYSKLECSKKFDYSSARGNTAQALSQILEGTINSNGEFVPTLKNNGGTTETVKMISDVLADGTNIRFPRSTDVTVDQRGESRFDVTCPGAYEIPFGENELRGALDDIVKNLKVKHQICSETEEGEFILKFSNNGLKGQLTLIATSEDGKSVWESEPSSEVSGELKISPLAAGKYKLSLKYSIGSTLDPIEKDYQDATIKAIGALSIDESSLQVGHLTCTDQTNVGDATLQILNWKDGDVITVTYKPSNGEEDVWSKETISAEIAADDLASLTYKKGDESYWDSESKYKTVETAYLTIPNCKPGVYTISVESQCGGIIDPFTFTVDPLEDLKIALVSSTPASCSNTNDGKAVFEVSGGYNCSVYDGDKKLTVTDGKCELPDLPVGEYTVTYKSDEEGCNDNIPSDPVVITPEETLKIVDASGSKVYCADRTGEASITVSGGNAPYTVVLTDDENNEVKGTGESDEFSIDGLTFGTQYKVKVSDANCETEFDKTVVSENVVESISKGDFKIVANRQRCSGKDNGSIEIKCGKSYTSDLVFTVTGTEGDYSPSSQESGKITFSNLPVGKYEVYADFAHESCSSTFSKIEIGEVEVKSIGTLSIDESLSSTSTDPTCVNEPNGEFKIAIRNWVYGDKVTISGFESPLTDVVPASTKRSEDSKVRLAYDENANVELGLSGDGYIDVVYLEGWNLEGNTYNVKLTDECSSSIDADPIVLNSAVKPNIEMVGKGNTELKCSNSSDGWAKYTIDNDASRGTFYINDEVVTTTDKKGNYWVKNLPAGVYNLKYTTSVAGCTDSDEDQLTISAPAELEIGVDFDADAAKCDLAQRKFTVNVSGGTSPYIYTVKDMDGNVIESSDAVDVTSYESSELDYGKYTVSVTDKNECSIVYDGGDLSVSPSHVLTAAMRKVDCGENSNVIVVAGLDDQLVGIKGIEVLDDEGTPYSPKHSYLNNVLSFYELPANINLKGVKATIDGDCQIFADFEDLPLDEDVLKNAAVTVKKQDQRCYGVNNGEIELTYTGYTPYYVYFDLVNVKDNTVYKNTDSQHFNDDSETSLSFTLSDLAPGEYTLRLHYTMGGSCDVVPSRDIQKVSIEEKLHKLEFVSDYPVVNQSTCHSIMNGNVIAKIQGWSSNFSFELYKNGEVRYDENDEFTINGDEATFKASGLDAGSYVIKCSNSLCENEKIDYPFTINDLEMPTVKDLATNNLLCTYSKAYIDFSFACSSAVNKRVDIHRVTNEGTEYGVIEGKYDTNKDNTFRMYGFSAGKVSYKEGTDYKLTDADAGLPDGEYRIYYFDTTKACNEDLAVASIKVQHPYVKLNLAKQDVLCYSQNNGVINLAPIRFGTATQPSVYYDYMDAHLDLSDIRAKGQNHGEVIFGTEADQEAYYNDRSNFISDLEFSDVKSISITSDNMDQADLYDLIKESIEKNGNLQYPLPNLYKNNGYEFAASDWIGFNAMPVGVYTVTVNDTYGCHYSESVEIKGPKDGLRVVEASYPEGDETASCDATKRRIKMTCTGGYYPYFYNVVKEKDENGNDVTKTNSGLYGSDYVADELVEKYNVGGDVYVDYTSKMLPPGTYKVSVMDTMGCIATYDKEFTVKAKYSLDAVPHVDLCEPSNSNKLQINTNNNSEWESAKYTLYIGHRTHCVDYPNCSVDTENDLLIEDDNNEGKMHHVHKCDESEFTECPHYTNCLQKETDVIASDIEYKVNKDDKWIIEQGYGLSGLPSGTVGVLATMADGCSAFDEYTFQSAGLPASIAALRTDDVSCNGGSNGAVKFSLFGGYESYQSLKLDGKDLRISHPNLQMITKTQSIKTVEETGEETGEETVEETGVTTTTVDSTVTDLTVDDLLGDADLFYMLRHYYDTDAIEAEARAEWKKQGILDPEYSQVDSIMKLLRNKYGSTSYSFRINDLPATINNEDDAKNVKHVLTVTDKQGCEASTEFDIYQPTKLHLKAAGSVECYDGSGRVFATLTEGGVPPYLYRLDQVFDADYTAVFGDDKNPKTYDGKDLSSYEDYENYYFENYNEGDHIPVGNKPHYMWVQDANGCVKRSDEQATLGERWKWENANQDQLISTWHDFGDILVVADQTDYSEVNDNAVYDSMKVVIVMNENSEGDMASKFEGIMQSKELYTYGVRECTIDDNDIVESSVDPAVYPAVYPEAVPDELSAEAYKKYNENRCGSVVTPFGIFETSWGISPQAQELYNELKAELVEKGRSNELEPIQNYFDQLVPDDAAKRMCFVKFQTKSDVKGDLGDILGELLEQHVNFTIRVVAYVGGCDVITEHNSLVLNLNGEDPFPGTNYKDIITVEPYPNPVTDGECTLHIKLSNAENDFDYSVFSLEGKKLQSGTISASSEHKVETDEYDTVNYVYDVKLSDLTDDCIIKVTTETNTAAVKVIVKNRE